MLTLEEALARCRAELPKLPTYFRPWEWRTASTAFQRAGGWVVVYESRPDTFAALFVTETGCFTLTGALGKTFLKHHQDLGVPLGHEQWIGSGPGRYQLFEKGIAVWDSGYVPNRDLGYPRFLEPEQRKGRDCQIFAAVFDLRDFTTSSDTTTADEIQRIVADLEKAFQRAFGDDWWEKVFVKGSGDGLIVVAEESWFKPRPDAPTPHSAVAFTTACLQTMRTFRAARPAGPSIGCGIDAGSAKQVFMLGQTDYLSPAVNHAAHIQSGAVNEIRVTSRVLMRLALDGEAGTGLTRRASRLGGAVAPTREQDVESDTFRIDIDP